MFGVSIPLAWKWPGADQSGEFAALAKRLDTIWDLEPHTAAKHAILRRYTDGDIDGVIEVPATHVAGAHV